MSTHKTKEELTRLAWLAALRRQGERQCTAEYFNWETRQACAMGILIEVALPPQQWAHAEDEDVDSFGALAGLNLEQCREVVALNDGNEGKRQHTFGEIADVVEAWFVKAARDGSKP
jgi:hypothetical protein